MFYPASRAELKKQIGDFLGEARSRAHGSAPKAMIAPHAGTIYSGPVAASAYVELESVRATIKTVVLLGPSHRVALQGLAASTAEAFTTPLGDVPVDQQRLRKLVAERAQVDWLDEAHRREHSLEVHLPFLQHMLDDFVLLPLVVGRSEPSDVAEVIDALWGGPETLLVVSSDLSHFHDYATACQLDRGTSELFEELAFEKLQGDQACGYFPVRGLLLSARRRGMRCKAIDVRNSGDTAGARNEVVGYGSFLFH